MSSIAFIDTEIDLRSKKILDIGSVKDDGSIFHKTSVADLIQFIKGTKFICGHNILNHDIIYIGPELNKAGIDTSNIIDTLFLSPLLFPTKPYHSLVKDDKLQSEDTNNPLNDSIKARDLFYDEITAFKQTDKILKEIFYLLLKDQKEFHSFFRFIAYTSTGTKVEDLIRQKFKNEICEQADISTLISKHPIELAYCLSLIHSFVQHRKIHSITPPWVLKSYPEVERIMFSLRNKPCLSGCEYCMSALNPHKALKKFFGFDSFKTYEGEPLQERAVKADFETINPKRKYKSDLEVFIRESKLEDLYKGGSETIFVSTIHKAKGKEFDNVFLMLENYDYTTDEAKRLLYVAMTRAKSNLIIHLNSNFLDRFTADNLERFENPNTYPPPNQLTMRLSFKDVWLGYFVNRQNLISGITSGETLTISADERLEYKGKCVLKFSRKFKKQIESLKERHYKLKSAKVDFIVYWKKEDTKQEIKIILPELYFERKTEVPSENTEKIPKNQASA